MPCDWAHVTGPMLVRCCYPCNRMRFRTAGVGLPAAAPVAASNLLCFPGVLAASSPSWCISCMHPTAASYCRCCRPGPAPASFLLGLLVRQPPAWMLLLLLLAAEASVCWVVLGVGVGCAAAGGATMLRVSWTTCHFSRRSADVVLLMEGLALT